MRNPDFFIVGAPKCGTTALYDYLKQHPEIFMPEAKEPHHFGKDLLRPSPSFRDVDKYLALFSTARDEKRLGEASTHYLYSRTAAAEIKHFNSAASIIIMLRNPVDMMYSLHSQCLYNGDEDITDFRAALDAGEDRKQGRRIPERAYLTHSLVYKEMAKYCEQVERYLAAFGEEKVKVIIYDDFKRDTSRVYADACAFLDVDQRFDPVISVLNSNKRARSESLQTFIERPPPTALKIVKALSPHSLRIAVAANLRGLNTDHKPRPPMPADLRRQLQEEFADEVTRLGSLLGRDLSRWCA